MSALSSGTSKTFTATIKGQLFTVSINGGAYATVSGAATDSLGPVQSRKTYGPFAIGQTLTVSVIYGEALVTTGDADPADDGEGFKLTATTSTTGQTVLDDASLGVIASTLGAIYIPSPFADGVAINNYNATNNGLSITNGTNIVNSGQSVFQAGRDEGKLIVVGAPSGNVFYRSVIVTVASSTQVVCQATHTGATISAGTGSGCFGTDRTVALQAIFDSTANTGATIYLPSGIICTSARVNLPNGTSLVGQGMDYGKMEQIPSRGSSIVLCAAPGGTTAALRVGSFGTATQMDSGTTAGSIRYLNVDACYGIGAAVETYGRRVVVERCLIKRGSNQALNWNSQNGWCTRNIIGQDFLGDCLVVAALDVKVHGNEMRQHGLNSHSIRATTYGDLSIIGNHMYCQPSASYAGYNVFIDGSASGENVLISNNQFDCTYGAQIRVAMASGQTLRGLSIVNNTIFQIAGFPDNTYPVIDLSVASAGGITGMVVTGNAGKAAGGAARYSSLIKQTGAGTIIGAIATPNAVTQCAAQYETFVPDTASTSNYTA